MKKEAGQKFIDWLISPEGQSTIADYKIDGEQLFFPNAGRAAEARGPPGRLRRAAGAVVAAQAAIMALVLPGIPPVRRCVPIFPRLRPTAAAAGPPQEQTGIPYLLLDGRLDTHGRSDREARRDARRRSAQHASSPPTPRDCSRH